MALPARAGLYPTPGSIPNPTGNRVPSAQAGWAGRGAWQASKASDFEVVRYSLKYCYHCALLRGCLYIDCSKSSLNRCIPCPIPLSGPTRAQRVWLPLGCDGPRPRPEHGVVAVVGQLRLLIRCCERSRGAATPFNGTKMKDRRRVHRGHGSNREGRKQCPGGNGRMTRGRRGGSEQRVRHKVLRNK